MCFFMTYLLIFFQLLLCFRVHSVSRTTNKIFWLGVLKCRFLLMPFISCFKTSSSNIVCLQVHTTLPVRAGHFKRCLLEAPNCRDQCRSHKSSSTVIKVMLALFNLHVFKCLQDVHVSFMNPSVFVTQPSAKEKKLIFLLKQKQRLTQCCCVVG